jgi:hypothetical protein
VPAIPNTVARSINTGERESKKTNNGFEVPANRKEEEMLTIARKPNTRLAIAILLIRRFGISFLIPHSQAGQY